MEESIKQDLFDNAMKGQWEEVEKIYKENPRARTVSITPAGDTALHLAILDGREDIVKNLVGHIEGTTNDHLAALKKANKQGNTPLHLAAKLGSARMCHCIAASASENDDDELTLAECRNKDGENPMFTAVLHGKTNAYRALVCFPRCRESGMSRKAGTGDTILHAAISGEYFELAFEIIHHYKLLIHYRNERGEFPLHVLATKPSAFRSGNHLNFFDEIVYSRILVKKLPPPLPIAELAARSAADEKSEETEKRDEHYFPENYQTCFMLPKLMIDTAQTNQAKSSNRQGDIEAGAASEAFPSNWNVIFEYIKLTYKAMLVILVKGSRDGRTKMEEEKKKHTWSIQIIEELLLEDLQSQYTGTMLQERGKPANESPFSSLTMVQEDQDSNVGSGTQVQETAQEKGKNETNIVISRKKGGASEVVSVDRIRELFPVGVYDKKQDKSVVLLAEENKQMKQKGTETPILVAAKNGITEIMERLIDKFPVAIHDTDAEEKNIVHLAVEHRQPHVFNFLLLMKSGILKEALFGKVDKNGNSALHLAARLLVEYWARNIPPALQMQWELKWYQYVKCSMPLHFVVKYNKEGETPEDIFTESHKHLMKECGDWMKHISKSCSVVAALIATVAFATSATIPGGFNNNGRPTLERQPDFDAFTTSSPLALICSVTALVIFLAILTSLHEENDFRYKLPTMLLFGLTSLFMSIAFVLASFFAGYSFVLQKNDRVLLIPMYVIISLELTCFAVVSSPLYYFALVKATFGDVSTTAELHAYLQIVRGS